jgi:ferric-dicitrate binding protein FerR (iron transport regulator)
MAKTEKAKSVLPYLQRLLEDEYVQEQVREAAVGLRHAYGRAATRREQAPEDKKLYDHLRQAATSIRDAAKALREPEPPPKRRARKVLIIGLAAGGAVLLTRLGRHQQNADSSSRTGDQTEAARPPGNGSVQPETIVAGT